MKYRSCRSTETNLSFEEAVRLGWANDGGMILPSIIPKVSEDMLKEWKNLSYVELCMQILSLYISTEEIPSSDLEHLINSAFHVFPYSEIITIKELNMKEKEKQIQICELWHGNTLAFKDLGMQVLVQCMNYFLNRKNEKQVILVGTSGDTGSSAIEAVKRTSCMEIIVLYPKGRISHIQELQMTQHHDEKQVYTIGFEGTSDDLDVPIEAIFQDSQFKLSHTVGSLNSVNICRILVQTVHYFYAYLQKTKTMKEQMNFYVPTGAGGHAVAGILAKKMGLENIRIIVCTNENDAFHKLLSCGELQVSEVKTSHSPSMDIQVPYNVERMLYLWSENPEKVSTWMNTLHTTKFLSIKEADIQSLCSTLGLSSVSLTSECSAKTIKSIFESDSYLLDPHTAVGVTAALLDKEIQSYQICMGCAHAAKFEEILATIFQTTSDEIIQMFPDKSHPSVERVLKLRQKKSKESLLKKENCEMKIRQLIREIVNKRKK